jgi:hypothetical protein
MWTPSTRPPLAGAACDRTRGSATASSAVTELVVEPGAAIELPVELPPSLRGAGCTLDRVVLAHSSLENDLAIAVRAGDRVTPIATYSALRPATVGAPLERNLWAVQHEVGMPAPDAFAIVVGADAFPFGIGVRPDRESPDPPLHYRAPGDETAVATHDVPQAAVVLTLCGLPAGSVLDAVE